MLNCCSSDVPWFDKELWRVDQCAWFLISANLILMVREAVRVLLGAAEAGLYPGIVLLITR